MADETRDERSAAARDPSRRNFIKIGLGVAVGATLASVAEIPYYSEQNYAKDKKIASLQAELDAATGQVQQLGQLKAQVTQLTTQTQSLQSEVASSTGFLYLGGDEQSLLEAAAEAIIPSDSNGPGAKEAGVIYFIDRQLASDYGTNGTMYMQGPFVLPGIQGPITVEGVTYPHGTPIQSLSCGTRYQYAMDFRYFWRWGLDAMQTYVVGAYGSDFEDLSTSKQLQALTDLWNNKPSSFNNILPVDFAFELYMMVWAGFLMDPLYGGNQNMVGWSYVGFNGTNMGDFYGEGHSPENLMVATSPTRLKPASLAQFQQQVKLL
jgi:gluconate 2-dehydrogenase gamma chain